MFQVNFDRGDGEGTRLWAQLPTLNQAIIQYDLAVAKAKTNGAVKIWIDGQGPEWTWEKPATVPQNVTQPSTPPKTAH